MKKMSGDQYLTEWCSPADYVKLFESLPLQVLNLAIMLKTSAKKKKHLECDLLSA